MTKDIRKLEIIDFWKKGNAVRLFLGKNDIQIGDDWNDTPYEHNAGHVYDEHIEGVVDIYFPVDIDVAEPADWCNNSKYCKNDFIYAKTWCIWVEDVRWEVEARNKPVPIFFGETLEKVAEKLKGYNIIIADRSKDYVKD